MQINGGFVVGKRGFLGGCEEPEPVEFLVLPYFGREGPKPISLVETNAAKSSSAILPNFSVHHVLRFGCKSEIRSSIVDVVPINMVNFQAIGCVHDNASHIELNTFSVDARHSGCAALLGPIPTPFTEPFKVGVINNREFSSCERNSLRHRCILPTLTGC